MKIFNILAALTLAFLLSACKKEPNRYSEWYVNGKKFSTNDVRVEIGKVVANLASNQSDNGFDLGFYFGFLPKQNTFVIINRFETSSPEGVDMGFHYNNNFYNVTSFPVPIMTASEEDGKARYDMPECWFINYNDPTDSVLVKGTFREP